MGLQTAAGRKNPRVDTKLSIMKPLGVKWITSALILIINQESFMKAEALEVNENEFTRSI